ncbi:hypothetical protein D3C81_1947730 [compost metagenome]
METRSGVTLVYAGDDAQEKFEQFHALVKAGKGTEANALVADLRRASHKSTQTPDQETDAGSAIPDRLRKPEPPRQN